MKRILTLIVILSSALSLNGKYDPMYDPMCQDGSNDSVKMNLLEQKKKMNDLFSNAKKNEIFAFANYSKMVVFGIIPSAMTCYLVRSFFRNNSASSHVRDTVEVGLAWNFIFPAAKEYGEKASDQEGIASFARRDIREIYRNIRKLTKDTSKELEPGTRIYPYVQRTNKLIDKQIKINDGWYPITKSLQG